MNRRRHHDDENALDNDLDVTTDVRGSGSEVQGFRLNLGRAQKQKQIGSYEVIELLGQGGMGTVFRARHLKLDKEVALKLIRPRGKSNEVVQARFDRELRAVGKLEHPNIVRALDAGEVNGVTFLSMELLQGLDLDQIAPKGQKLSVADASEVIRQSALGLKYVHDEGLIHRDIKPSNLMLAKDPVSSVRVKVMDLGLALIKGDAEDERLTDEGVAIGTFRYMSLEQARNTRSVDHRADVYSLGATYYRLLIGEPPYAKDRFATHAQLLMALMSGEVPDVAAKVTDLPSPLGKLITRMLAKDPDERPQDMTEIIETVTPFALPHQLGQVLEQGLRDRAEATKQQPDRFTELIGDLMSEPSDSLAETSPSADLASDDLGILRQRVRRFWVDGVLSRTKDSTQLFPLRREILIDCVTSPWEGIAQSPVESFDPNVPIDQLFEYAERSLLILGDAGSGKSTTLLELAEYLLKKSESSSRESVPVLLHLSTWTRQHRSFEKWIVQELNAKYQIPQHIGREFVDERRLVLLLDGMDEVRTADQQGCIEALNDFLSRFMPPGVVVCARYTEYSATGSKLRMHGAMLLKPLTPEQIMDSITGSTGARRPLIEALGKHEALLELASCPLMLSMMKVSFDDSDPESIHGFSTIESARENLFDAFVDDAFRTKHVSTSNYSRGETVSWLSWIAKQMQHRNQSVFVLDELQPEWFTSLSQKLIYLVSLSLILGAISGATTMYFWYRMMPIMDTAASTPYASLYWLMLQMPIWWAAVCFFDLFVFPKRTSQGLTGRFSWGIAKAVLYCSLWMIWPVIGHLSGIWTTGWTIANVLLGLPTSGFVGFLGRRKRVTVDVDVAQPLGVSAYGSLGGWALGYALGFVVYATYLFLWALYLLEEPPDWFPYFWKSAEERCVSVAWPLAFSSVGIVAGGLAARMKRGRTAPDQSLKIYFRNTLIAGTFSIISVFVTGLFVLYWWLNLPDNPLEFSLGQQALVVTGGVVWTALYIGLSFGALDLLAHGLTRMILQIDGIIPKRMSDFLKHSTRLGLLRRAGGAHIFTHRMLLEYFADKESMPNQNPVSY